MIVFHSVTVPSPSTKVIGSTKPDGQTGVCSLPPQLSIRRQRHGLTKMANICRGQARGRRQRERGGSLIKLPLFAVYFVLLGSGSESGEMGRQK